MTDGVGRIESSQRTLHGNENPASDLRDSLSGKVAQSELELSCDRVVLHVINRLSMGGSQGLLLRTVHELQRRGIESAICVLESDAYTDDCYRSELFPTYLNFSGDYRDPFQLRACVRSLCHVVESKRPVLVHSYLWTSDFVSAIVAGRCDIPHLCHIVDRRKWQTSRRWVHRLRRWGTRRAFRRADTRFVAVSGAAKEFACENMGYAPGRVAIAYNGIDVDDVPWIGTARFSDKFRPLVVGSAGRLEEEKGHRYLIEAIHLLQNRGVDVRLKITGDGRLRGDLESLVEKLGLIQSVEFLGWVPDVLDFYRQVDVFAVPSIAAEGLPTTILEAMASGSIVVASDVGGAGEAIEHDESGFLVAPGSAQCLAEQLEHVVRTHEHMPDVAIAARHRIETTFSTQRMVDSVLEQYHVLLSGNCR